MKKLCWLLWALLWATGSASALEGTMALRVSAPLVVSVTPGLHLGHAGDFEPVLQADLGVGGGKLLVGADSFGEGFGWGLKAGLLRTWLAPIVAEKEQTFLGVELEVGYRHLFASVGIYGRIEGDQGGNALLTGGLGWLF